MNLIKTFAEYEIASGSSSKLNVFLRNNLIRIFAAASDIGKSDNWIRFPYYHHVFDDEKTDFERQMKYLRNYGDFISIDTACDMILKKEKITGKYFCISFDDGYYCCYSNMLEITASMNIPVIIYLPTNLIGLNPDKQDDFELLKKHSPEHSGKVVPYLSWEQCREMTAYKVTFGSHTMSHANLINLSLSRLKDELKGSKNIIEENTGLTCTHFACPWGKVNVNFKQDVVNPILTELGYRSLATTHRGKNDHLSDTFFLKRDHLLAGWDNYQLKYFFSR